MELTGVADPDLCSVQMPAGLGKGAGSSSRRQPVSGRMGEGRTVHRRLLWVDGASPGPCLEEGGSWCFTPIPTALPGLPPGV